ncbi:MAG TPA: carboxypeptidase regulatory-like domain-containing protein [Terriglobales bacterium]|nr:carboxypeptidase regulatory-like domain-containing protein [Terriglobales bacterium]
MLVLLGLSCSAAQEQAQTAADKAAINGKVTDRTGAVVRDAKAVLTSATGASLAIPVNDEGMYSVPEIYPGTYTLTVSAANFADVVFDNIRLLSGRKLTLDATLEPASEKSTVEAAGEKQVRQGAASPAHTATAGKGAVRGTVTDQTGAVVAGAQAVLTGPASEKVEVTVDVDGTYSFTGLKAGTYTLTVTAPNFAPRVFDNLTLTAGLELSLDAQLQPASAKAEEVNVESGNLGRVETETSTVSGTITQKEVVSIGLNGRNFTQLIALAPGVSNQTGQDEAKVGVVGSVKYSVNGGRVEYNTFEVDGSDVLNTGLNGASSTLAVYPSLDAIQEVKVLTSNYGAQYGRTASGTVQVTTKSGGPKFHGKVYDFIRNEAFNSRNYFDIVYTSPPPPGQLTGGQTFGTKAPLYRRQDFGGTIGGPIYIPGVLNTKKNKSFFFYSEEFRLEKTPTEFNQAVPGLKERGLIMTPQGVQKNLQTSSNGVVYQDFDFSDVCPLGGANGFSRAQFPDCPGILESNGLNTINSNHLEEVVAPGSVATYSVDKNAVAILNSNLIPLPNAPYGCNFSVVNFNPASPDPSDPNRCYVAAVSPSTYWREELFRIDHLVTDKIKVSFRYIHDSWNTTVLTPQWGVVRDTFPTVQNTFIGPGTSLVAGVTQTISPTLLNDLIISYVNSNITLTDLNGPGGAVFQRDPTLDQPLVADPSAPGQCNPMLSVDPATGIPQCAMGYIFKNGFGGKMPGLAFLGTNAAYGGTGFAVDPSYMPWGHSNPTYAVRDDIGKAFGKHTLQFGAQYVYSQRNQNNNAIGAASGDVQGLLTYSNLAHSTGNAFADFLVESTLNPPHNPQGFIQSFTQDSAQHRYYQRYQIGEPYVQDDWKVTPRLTLNLGLRISLFGTYREKNRNAWNWEPARFNASRFAVDPVYGELLDKTAGSTPVPFNPVTFQLDSGVVSDLGLVRCGYSGTPASCMNGHLFNTAPRIGFAWDPQGNGKTSIRGGYGIFFEHGTGNEANTGSLEASAPVVLSMTQQLPVSFPCIGNVGYGSAFDPTNAACASSAATKTSVQPTAGSVFPLDVTSIPTKAIWPYAQQWSFGVQRELTRALVLNVAYVGSKGTHLTVERQLNQLAPLPPNQNPFGPNEPMTITDCTVPSNGAPGPGNYPGDGTTAFLLQNGTQVTPQNPAYMYLQAACTNPNIPNVNSLPGRPYPGLGRIFSLQNVANSNYNALQTTLRHSSGPLTLGVSYSYSHSIDDASDRSDPVLVNSYDLTENRASSSFDERHLLNISYVYQLPLKDFPRRFSNWANEVPTDPNAPKTNCCSRLSNSLLDGWELSGVTLVASGTPFTVINSAGNTGISLTDNAGVSSGLGIADSYPDVVKGQQAPVSNPQSFGPLIGNPSQFVAPRGLTFGDAGRNFLNNPRRTNFDVSLLKNFKIRETGYLQFRAEAFNVFNHTQFRIYDPDNQGSTGNNIISCYAGPVYSAGFKGSAADCVTGASFLHPVDAHRPRTIQFGLKLGF